MATMVGVEAKIERGRDALHSLIADIGSFTEKQIDFIQPETDDTSGRYRLVYSGDAVVPIEWSVTIGEIMYNFRSALDHLIWQLVLSNENTPGRNNEFPVFLDESRFNQNMNRMLKGISPTAIRSVKQLQPWNENYDSLSTLDELCNIDKHRHLNLVLLRADFGSFSGTLSGATSLRTGPVERNSTMLEGSREILDLEFRPRFDVAFAESELELADRYVYQTLLRINAAVHSVVTILRDSIQ